MVFSSVFFSIFEILIILIFRKYTIIIFKSIGLNFQMYILEFLQNTAHIL